MYILDSHTYVKYLVRSDRGLLRRPRSGFAVSPAYSSSRHTISGTLKVEFLVSGTVCTSVVGLVFGLSLGCVADGRSPGPARSYRGVISRKSTKIGDVLVRSALSRTIGRYLLDLIEISAAKVVSVELSLYGDVGTTELCQFLSLPGTVSSARTYLSDSHGIDIYHQTHTGCSALERGMSEYSY